MDTETHALTSQMAMKYPCRVTWQPELQNYSVTAEVLSSQGQLLFKGLAAKVTADGCCFPFFLFSSAVSDLGSDKELIIHARTASHCLF